MNNQLAKEKQPVAALTVELKKLVDGQVSEINSTIERLHNQLRDAALAFRYPYHVDGCGHGLDCYLGSYEDKNNIIHDVYLHKDNGRQKICIRDSSEYGGYTTPYWDNSHDKNKEHYPDAMRVVELHGIVLDHGVARKNNMVADMRQAIHGFAYSKEIVNEIQQKENDDKATRD